MSFKSSFAASAALALAGVMAAAAASNAAEQQSPAAIVSHGSSHAAGAASFRAGTVLITNAWARATPAGARIGGGYLTIENSGTSADRLIGFSSPLAARGEIHEMAVTGGVMKMREVDGVDIAPGASVALRPGGLHLMFVDIKQPLVSGQTFKARLTFEKAGPVDVEFAVAPVGANAAPGQHSHH